MLKGIEFTFMNLAFFFGHYVIIAMALNYQYGNAGVPNMISNVSVACGAYTVSSLVLRLCLWIGGRAGLTFKPDWIYDNPTNVSMFNFFLETKPMLSFALFLSSVVLAFAIGCLVGGFIYMFTWNLRSTNLIVVLFIVSEFAALFAANVPFIAGGTQGAYVPKLLSWYHGDEILLLALITLLFGLGCYYLTRTMINSPFGRLMRAVRENELTVMSTGKSVPAIRRDVSMFASGLMAVSGVLFSFYYSYVHLRFFSPSDYTFWPWLMVTLGGIGNSAGTSIGVFLCVIILRARARWYRILHTSSLVQAGFWLRIIDDIESMLLSVLLLSFFVLKPQGIIKEKKLRIPGINYKKLVWNPFESKSSQATLEKEKTRET
jgi:branched-chain amino acid transport system permease protein